MITITLHIAESTAAKLQQALTVRWLSMEKMGTIEAVAARISEAIQDGAAEVVIAPAAPRKDP